MKTLIEPVPMTEAEYHSVEALSSSGLRCFGRSPQHYFAEYIAKACPKTDSRALIIGRALHCAALEPDEFDVRYAVAPKVDRRTKAGKAAWQSFQDSCAPGQTVLTEEEETQVRSMTAALRACPEAQKVLEACPQREVSHVLPFSHGGYELMVKARFDLLGEESGGLLLADLKTTEDATGRAFGFSVRRYGYHVQAAWYLRLARACYEAAVDVESFRWLVVEKSPPYVATVHRPSADLVAEADQRIDELLDQFCLCEAADEWPGPAPALIQ